MLEYFRQVEEMGETLSATDRGRDVLKIKALKQSPNVLSLVASENAVTLLPAYFHEFKHPGVVFVPVSDVGAKWDFIVLWQRGKVPASTRALVHMLKESAARFA